MPYLSDDHKNEIENVCDLDHDASYIASKDTNNFAGAVNYINYVIIKKRVEFDGGTYRRYMQFALWVGTMLCCILEVYRRLIAPYENEAIIKNGDVD